MISIILRVCTLLPRRAKTPSVLVFTRYLRHMGLKLGFGMLVSTNGPSGGGARKVQDKLMAHDRNPLPRISSSKFGMPRKPLLMLGDRTLGKFISC